MSLSKGAAEDMLEQIRQKIEDGTWSVHGIEMQKGTVNRPKYGTNWIESVHSGELTITFHIRDEKEELRAQQFLATEGLPTDEE